MQGWGRARVMPGQGDLGAGMADSRALGVKVGTLTLGWDWAVPAGGCAGAGGEDVGGGVCGSVCVFECTGASVSSHTCAFVRVHLCACARGGGGKALRGRRGYPFLQQGWQPGCGI